MLVSMAWPGSWQIGVDPVDRAGALAIVDAGFETEDADFFGAALGALIIGKNPQRQHVRRFARPA